MYKSFRSLQKSRQTDRQRCCPAQGRMLPRFSPSLAGRGEIEYMIFTLFLTQKLVPGPAAFPGAGGPGSSSCLQPERWGWWGKGLGAAGRSPRSRSRAQRGHWKMEQKAAWLGCPAPLASAGRDTHGCLVLARRVGQGQRDGGDPWERFPVLAPGRGCSCAPLVTVSDASTNRH